MVWPRQEQYLLAPRHSSYQPYTRDKLDTIKYKGDTHLASEIDRKRLERLLLKVANGDQSAFAEFYQRTAAHIHSLLRHMLPSQALTEDVLQDTYIAVWTRAGDFRASKGTAMTWLITIARYRAIDVLRKEARKSALDDIPEQAIEDTDEPISVAMLSSDIALLNDCIQGLASQERECVELAFYRGATHMEVSSKLNKPLGSIKTWIRRGLMNLKRCLTQ